MREPEVTSRQFAKRLRRQMTNAETILWSRLRLRSQHGRTFRRQHPIGPYIADFASVQAHLVIEVDGATHGSDAEITHDRRRDAYLRSKGWRVIRVSNDDVYKNLNGVLDMILCLVPPPPRERAAPPP
ncbi:MAG: endonuclease domain-containing protein [Rhizomicrobium sp.]